MKDILMQKNISFEHFTTENSEYYAFECKDNDENIFDNILFTNTKIKLSRQNGKFDFIYKKMSERLNDIL